MAFRILADTPAALGYSFPPEWAPHRGTWLSWPRPEGISFPDKYHTVPPVLARLVGEIARREEVHVNVPNGNYARIVRETLAAHGVRSRRVHLHHIATNEAWCRDHGPIYVVRDRDGKRERAINDWGYNAWGGKYMPCDNDDVVPTRIAEEMGEVLFKPGIVMEGGSIDVNGRGTLITTEACLLNPNRNPQLNQTQIEQYLKDYLGVTNILWLGDGIVGDDTDGHVDDLTRFVSPDTVVTVIEDDPQDENYELLKANYERLLTMRDQDGLPLRIVKLPMPGARFVDEQRVPMSYANFYIANGSVLVPTYRHPNDAKACEVLQSLFPDRRVMGIDCTDLIWGLGSIHCVTQQQPAVEC